MSSLDMLYNYIHVLGLWDVFAVGGFPFLMSSVLREFYGENGSNSMY